MPSYLTLQCPSCGGRTRFAAGGDRFVCDYCSNEHLFNLPGAQPAGIRAATVDQPAPLPAPRPRQVSVEKQAGALKFSWRWFSFKYVPMAFFCVAWDGFLCFWYSMALGMGNGSWIMLVFPIFHLAVGVFLTYTTIAGFLNRTSVLIDSQNFVIRHDPAPWPGEVNTPVANLAQLYCTENRSTTKRGESFSYELHAVLRDGRQLKLVSSLESPEIAQFLEQEIEGYLRITDRPVMGEFRYDQSI